MSLFSDNFPVTRTSADLTALIEQHSHYDPSYVCIGSSSTRVSTKAWLEGLWQQHEPYADNHFLKEFKTQLTQRAWEMYLGSTLLNRGFKLGRHQGAGPDFEIKDKGIGGSVWIEAIAVKKGDGKDRVPDLVYGRVVNIPTDEMVLRIAGGLDAKYKKYACDLEKGCIKETDPYIIALDKSELEHLDAALPNVLRATFGIGDPVLEVRVGGKRVEEPKASWTAKFEIKKQSGKPVSMLFFEKPEHAGISAIIYAQDHVINSPRDPSQMGENFTIIHNPFARNPLPDGFFPFGDEYKAIEGYVEKVKEAAPFDKPDPLSF